MERPSDRDLVLEIAQAGIARVAPGPMIDQLVHTTDSHAVFGAGSEATRVAWSEVDRVLVLGAGKASAAMARALEGVLGDRISGGCVVTKYDHGVPLERIELIEAGHPVPDEQSLAAAQRIAARADEADERTLVVLLISGGGSSLLAAPLSPSRSARETRTGETSLASLTLDDLAATTRLLLGAGAPIGEVNCVRRHLSDLAGGRLAVRLQPARAVALVLSDVIGDRLEDIASGLVAPDPSSYADALRICEHYGIADQVPPRVRAVLDAGVAGVIPDTPDAAHPAFERLAAHLIGSNRSALEAAGARARAAGLKTLLLSSQISGEAREVAQVYAGIARDTVRDTGPLPRPACILAGGETTVTLRGSGRGGRNQEMALAVLRDMRVQPEAYRGVTFLSIGTDGTDGPTDAAGGVVDVNGAARVDPGAIDAALASNDAYTLLDRAGCLVRTGPTMTNVCDLQVIIVR